MGRVFLSGGMPDIEKPGPKISASEIAVGSSVYLMFNGAATEFLVIHQGNPDSSLYDASCNGTWLLMKDIYEKRAMDDTGNSYADSDMHRYLNGDFLALFGKKEKTAIQQAIIPYRPGSGSSAGKTVSSGADGLSTKVFLLGAYEVGLTQSNYSYLPIDGAKLDYFGEGTGTDAKNIRIAYYDGTATIWRLRSPRSNNTYYMQITAAGTYGSATYSTANGIRPALILSSTARFDEETLLLKEVP